MKKVLIVLIFVAAANFLYQEWQQVDRNERATPIESADDTQSSDSWRAGQQVQGSGTVLRTLADDNEGSRHQRFILELSSGQTVLVAHNIDLAPKITSIRSGDTVRFYGEFEPNERGGVIHWTHHDPQGRHVGGWLEHKGVRYE